MSGSQQNQRSISLHQFIIGVSLCFIAALFITHNTVSFKEAYWFGHAGEYSETRDGARTPITFREVRSSDTPFWLHFEVPIIEEYLATGPLGVMTAGPFSADIYWDGELVGNKGRVRTNDAAEIPGPIDSVIYLGERQSTLGNHRLSIHISNDHAHEDVRFLLHTIAVLPYSADARRSLRYYALPILFIGLHIFLIIQQARIGREAGRTLHSVLALFGVCVLVHSASEVSRALINYDYSWHFVRGTIMGFASFVAPLVINVYFLIIEKDMRVRGLLLAGILVANIFGYQTGGGDMGMLVQLKWTFVAPAVLYAWRMIRGQFSFWSVLPVFTATLFISAELSVPVLLDNYYFIASTLLIAAGWAWAYVGNTAPNAVPLTTMPEPLVIKGRSGDTLMQVSDILYLKADGNYTEVHTKGGDTHLHSDRIGTLADILGADFMRVHRSYLVKVDMIASINSLPGSKYIAKLGDGVELPVSRYRVAELRERLK